MAKMVVCGICELNSGETVTMNLKKGFFECMVCGSELWFTNETNQSINKLLAKECGLRNDQHAKLTNIDNKAHGCFEGNFR